MRVVLYTGKGGVGKTTSAAATAVWAAQRGQRTLVASADAAHSLGDVLGERLGPSPARVSGLADIPDIPDVPGLGRDRLDAVEVDARAETERHWGAIRDYLVSIFRHQGIEEVVADELALLPGAEELTTLLAVEAYAREGAYDLVVVDCAPTDSALRLLTLPEVARGSLRVLLRLQRAVAGVVTPLARNLVGVPLPDSQVFRDAEELLYDKLHRLRELVTSPNTTTRLVVTPERMVIDEALRAYTDLSLFELPVDAVAMNRLLPAEAAGEPFFRDQARREAERLEEVRELFAPLPVLTGALQDDEVTGAKRLAEQGRALFGDRDPGAVLCTAPGVRFEPDGDGYRASIPLPHADPAALDVAKLEDQLVIETGTRRRLLPLPRRIAHFALAGASLRDGALTLRFVPEAGA